MLTAISNYDSLSCCPHLTRCASYGVRCIVRNDDAYTRVRVSSSGFKYPALPFRVKLKCSQVPTIVQRCAADRDVEHHPLMRRATAACPYILPVMTVKYPMLAAAIDKLLSKAVRDNGEAVIAMLLDSAMSEPVPEKLPPIPVTKEEIAWEKLKVAGNAIGWEEHAD